MDQEFPPLPKRTESQTAVHSRVSSVQSSHGIRTGTPKIPPGLERIATPKVPPGLEKNIPSRFATVGEDLHAHPLRVHDQTDKTSPKKQTSTPGVVPVVPAIPIIQHKANPKSEPIPAETSEGEIEVEKEKQSEIDAAADEIVAVSLEESKGEAETVTPVTTQQVELQITDTVESTPSKAVDLTMDSPVAMEPVVLAAEEASDKQSEQPKQSEQVTSEIKAEVRDSVVTSSSTDVLPDLPKDKVLEAELVSTPITMSADTVPLKEKKAEIKRPALRTLNITSEMVETLRRSESQAPLSTTTEKSTAFPTLSQIRQSSRQPSISVSTNISRPSTPAASDRFGLLSQDVSRAGSPPPGGFVVGSAPSRQKTKNQAKKDRREKAKKATEASETGSVAAVATPPPADEVGPIVARQKKQKKAKAPSNANATATHKKADENEANQDEVEEEAEVKLPAPSPQKKKTEQVPPKKEPEPPVVEKAPTPKPATPTPVSPEPQQVSYTLRDFYTDASKLQSLYPADDQAADEQIRADIQDLLASKVSPFPRLLSEMVASGDLARDHPLFSPASFTSSPYKLPSDHRKGQAYLDGNNYSSNDVFGMIYLPQKEKKALYHGHAVSIADPAPAPTSNGSSEPREDLLRRCLITPTGWVLRHLSRDESEKLLDLEERRQMYQEEFGDLGRMDRLGALEDNDYVNLEGGFDEISRFGDRHGVCWVMDQDNGRGGRKSASRTNEDDYGLGEMPIDADDFDGDEDRYDDPEDDGDEDIDDEELEGEDLIQRVVAEDDRYDDEEDDDLGSFANLTGDPSMSMTLPPLPPSMMMNMNMDMPVSSGWDNSTYPERSTHTMYGSLNTPNTYGLPYTTTSSGYVMDEILPPTSELPVPRSSNSNVLPPIRSGHGHEAVAQESVRVNLRAMNDEELGRRVKEKQREIENARRETERLEKTMAKKGKELGRWRDGMFRGLAVGGA
ncbi:hypothetical protein ES702_01197 [subsurface metagenome]